MDCVVAVFSLTERASLAEAGAEVARLQARVPAILVGNKTDLVRTRRVSAEGDQSSPLHSLQCLLISDVLLEARAVAAACDCKYVEVQCRSAGRGHL